MTINLKGGQALSQFLQAFPANVQRNAVNSGLRAGANVLIDQAKANAPKKTGKLAKGITKSNPRKNEDGVLSIKVYVKGEHSFVANWLEYGTGAHMITAGDSGLSPRLLTRSMNRDGASSDTQTRALRIGNQYVTGAVMHPGATPKPFMRPALDTKASEIIDVMGEAIRNYLSKKTGFTAPTLEAA